ncbi:MAG: PAS domain S-box protein [Chloroflexota bacterium]|nr:PAS domain S-box protein [Chloroflexota bacterium]
MKDIRKTKKQLISELEHMRQRVSGLEAAEAAREWGGVTLRDSEEKLRVVFESMRDSVIITDLEGKIVEVNDAAVRVGGHVHKEDLIGRNSIDYIAGKDRPGVTEAVKYALSKEGRLDVVEYTSVGEDGGEFDSETSAALLRDSSGNPTGMIFVSREVTERKQLEKKLREKNNELQLILDSVPAYIFYKDREGRLVNVSKALAGLAYVSKDKLLQKTVFELTPDMAKKYDRDDMEVIATGRPKVNIEEPLVLSGEARWLRTDKLPIKDDGGNVIGLIGFSVDITDLKRAEEALRESEEKLRGIFESIGDAVTVVDLEGKIVEVNESAVRLYGYERKDEIIGRKGEEFIAEEDRPRLFRDFEEAVAGESAKGITEYAFLRKDGGVFCGEAHAALLHDNIGNPTGFISVTRDVTDRIQAEKALRDSEEKLRIMFDSMMDGVVVSDLNVNIVDVNSAVSDIMGGSKEDLIGRNAFDIIKFKDQEKALANLSRIFEEHRFQEGVDYSLVLPDGREMDAEISTAVMSDSSGTPTGFINVIRDVTERRRMEEALRDSEEKYRDLVENTNDLAYTTNAEGNLTYIGPQVVRYGYSQEDIVGKPLADFISPLDRERLILEYASTMESGQEFPSQFRLVGKDGSEYWFEDLGRARRNESGNVIGLSGILRDVTERKLAEEALRDSEEKFRVMFESMRDAVVVTDMNANVTDVNRAAIEILGYSREELLGRSGFDVIALGDRGKAAESFDSRSGEGYLRDRQEYKLLTRSGRELDTEISIAALYNSSGAPAGFISVVRDVTERRQAAEDLGESEAKYRLLAEHSLQGIVIAEGFPPRFVYANKTIADISGYTVEEILAFDEKQVKGIVHLEDREGFFARYKARIQNRPAEPRYEFRLVRKDGTLRWLESYVSVIEYEGETAAQAAFVDVTERRQAEDALRESEERYRLLAENVSDVIWTMDLNLNFTYISPSVFYLRGYTAEEAMSRTVAETVTPASLDVAMQVLEEELIVDGGEEGDPSRSRTLELEMLRKDGSTVWTEAKVSFLYDADGNRIGLSGVTRDMTEHRKVEGALRESEEKYRGLVEMEKDVICSVDTVGFITAMNSAVKAWGYTPEEMVGGHFLDIIAPEWREVTATEMQEHLVTAGEYIGETMAVDKAGSYRPIEYSAKVIQEEGQYAGARAVVRDIGDRKRAEDVIQRHTKRMETLHAVAHIVNQSVHLGRMLDDALVRICEVMDAEHGIVYRLDAEEQSLRLEAQRGVPAEALSLISVIRLTDDEFDRMQGWKRAVNSYGEAFDSHNLQLIRDVAERVGIRSFALVRISIGEGDQGVLGVFSAEHREYSEDDLDLLSAIADELAVGIGHVQLLEKTREMSVTDELTGLYNRRHFFAMLEAEMHRSQRSSRPFSLVMLDLDGFKEYNDKFGHTNGDSVLQSVAQVLRSSIRKSDMAFRYGGDEFALIISAADGERALRVVQRTKAKWQSTVRTQSLVLEGRIGFSTGIAEYPENAESADGLVFLTDAALYQAKRKGGFSDKLVSELRTLSPEILDVATQDQVYALAATVDARDPYTYGHSKRVAEIAVSIGKAIGLSDEELAKLNAAALLHDIGKVGVPDAILTKFGQPTSEEWIIIKRHCAEGAKIVGYVKELEILVPVILHHHEWYDGTGYPDGLKGADIPIGARITSVADAYDTMVTKRPYRKVISHKEACEELQRYGGRQFDPKLVEVWCRLVNEATKGR